MPALEQYQELLKQPTEPDTVKALRQPERSIIVSFKVFKFLLERIEKLEARADAKKQIADWPANNTRPGNGRSFAVPAATPPRE